jgi:hypothetical protein
VSEDEKADEQQIKLLEKALEEETIPISQQNLTGKENNRKPNSS